MKLLHVITSLGHGGAQRQLAQLSGALANQGFEQQIVTLRDDGDFSRGLIAESLPVQSLGAERSVWQAWRRLRDVVQTVRPAIIQSWLYHANLAATLAGSVSPVIWNIRHSLHDLALEKCRTRAIIAAGAPLSRRPAAVVFNSQRVAEQHWQAGYSRARSVIIENGVDLHLFTRNPYLRADQRARWGASDNEWVIGLVGRYHPTKGVDVFFEALTQVAQQRSDIVAVVVGDGMEDTNPAIRFWREPLARLRALHLEGPSARIAQVYSGMDILVSASSGEASSNVVAEASAMGVPCVVTDVGDSPRIAGDAGVVLTSRSGEALAQALINLISDGREAWAARSARAERHVRSCYSIERSVDAYSELYRRVALPGTRKK